MQNDQHNDHLTSRLLSIINILLLVIGILVIAIIAMPFIINRDASSKKIPVAAADTANADTTKYWIAADIGTVTDSVLKKQLEYGKDLVAHTSRYFGPRGTIAHINSGMNCQNCHLQAGTAIYGNNFGSSYSLFPKFMPRVGSVQNMYGKVNDCFTRSMNGKPIDTTSKEMQAIVAYIHFVSGNVPKGVKAAGSGLKDFAFLDRAADPAKGQVVYVNKCQSCHQADGAGMLNTDSTEYTYPPLWGANSFNNGASLYRIGRFAKYIKFNMPQGTTFRSPQLSDEEAWDVAAYVVSKDRPHLNIASDWPDISLKAFDHPFGPYKDSFSEQQHKYGPFKPILDALEKKGIKP